MANADSKQTIVLAHNYLREAVDKIVRADVEHDLIQNVVANIRTATRELDDVIEELESGNIPPATNPNASEGISRGSGYKVKCHVAIIIGHTDKAPGAYSKGLDISEYPYWKAIASNRKFLQTLQSQVASISVHTRDNVGIAGAYRDADQAIEASGYPGFTIELHFNGSVSTSANYSVTLYYEGSTGGKFLAEQFETYLGHSNSKGARGISRSNDDRGAYNLSLSRNPSILIEPFFGSYEHVDQGGYELDSWKQHIAQCIASIADDYINRNEG